MKLKGQLGSFFVFVLLLTSFQFSWALDFPYVPNPNWTYGSLCTSKDSDFRGYFYKEQIPRCHRNVKSSQKRDIYDHYGVPEKCRGQYTIDHFIPLSMGGTNDENNLWPEHQSVKATRQNLEFDVYIELKEGRLTQEEAVDIIVTEKLNPPAKEIPYNPCMVEISRPAFIN